MNSESSQPSERKPAQAEHFYADLQAPSIDQVDFYNMHNMDTQLHQEEYLPVDSEENRILDSNQFYQEDEEEQKGEDCPQLQTEQDYSVNLFKKQKSNYQTQDIHRQFLQKASLFEHSRDHELKNVFSNSFDESASSFDVRPHRTCKSSTRMNHNTSKNMATQPVNMQGVNGNTGETLTASSLTRRQDAFTNYMKSKQQLLQTNQSNYQQRILSQMQRGNTLTSFEATGKNITGRDLSNRSTLLNSSFAMNQYLQGTQNLNNKPVTPHTGANQAFHTAIMNASGTIHTKNPALNYTTVDPYAYLRWQQQKYKSCRSMIYNKQHQGSGGAGPKQVYKDGGQGNNSAAKKGASSCSSAGSSHYNTTTTTIPGAVKCLSEVKNPQFFISFRFADRKVHEISQISQFKNLTELDISGNHLNKEIVELKSLNFLKKLNLANNQIQEVFPLPQTLEILNLSYNQLKTLNRDSMAQLKNLTTLDISNNGLELLNGIQHLKRLKRLISKNNQIQDLDPITEITTLVELDLENNPVDSYKNLSSILFNKKDILVLNLKLSPLMLTLSNYEQFIKEVEDSIDASQEQSLDVFKNRLKHFSNGCLFRSRRVYQKLRSTSQFSKRSNSNVSNGSLSCGRATNILNNNNAFSPLLGGSSVTPNQPGPNSRQEDIEMLYDEILNEEEDIERKRNRQLKKKLNQQRKEAGDVVSDDDDSGQDDSFYDEDYINQTMSDEGEELLSYRNNQPDPQPDHLRNDYLNESTADFNKEIREINQELRAEMEQLGHVEHPEDAIKSLQSTQSMTTNKKNPMFKLDLSKCKQDQSNDDSMNEDDDNNFDIPELNHIKVTDDSFRQMQKQPITSGSKRSEIVSLRSDLKKLPQQSKPIVIPKLQLGMLAKGTKEPSHVQAQILSYKQQQSASNKSSDTQLEIRASAKKPLESSKGCQHVKCKQLQREVEMLKSENEQLKKEHQQELQSYRSVIEDIQKSLSHRGSFEELPGLVKEIIDKYRTELKSIEQICNDLRNKCDQFEEQRQTVINESQAQKQAHMQQQNDFESKQAFHLKTIDNLQSQLKSLNDINSQLKQEIEVQFKSFQQQQQKPRQVASLKIQIKDSDEIDNKKPDFFYRSEQVLKENESPDDEAQTQRQRKKTKGNVQNSKRPQSVAEITRRNSKKIHRLYLNNQNNSVLNEYGSINDITQGHQSQLSMTMNKKVGVFIEKLRERNSSLQERLNLSLNHIRQSKKVDLNLTQQQNQSNIITPVNYQSIDSQDPPTQQFKVPNSTSSQESFTNLLRSIPKPDQANAYQQRELKHQAKTQRSKDNMMKFTQMFSLKRDSLVIKSKPNEEYPLNLSAVTNTEGNYSSTQSDCGKATNSERGHCFRQNSIIRMSQQRAKQ